MNNMKFMNRYKKVMVQSIVSKMYKEIKQKQESGITDESIKLELTDTIYEYLDSNGYI